MHTHRAILFLTLATSGLQAQFITPDYRSGNEDANFAHWQGFDVAYTDADPPYAGLDGSQVNIPFAGGNQYARVGQYGAPTAFITSSLGIYSFSENATAFKVYDNPSYSPGEILFQTKTLSGSQSTPDFSSVSLFYRTTDDAAFTEAEISVSAEVDSSDSVGNIYTAWEWDTSSLNIFDYYIQFAYELPHSAIVEAQLDTNETFEPQLEGFGLEVESNVPFGLLFGLIQKSPEKLIYNENEPVEITYVSNGNFEFVKWITPDGESTTNPLNITVTENTHIDLVLAPVNYGVWRQTSFPSILTGEVTPTDLAVETDYDQDSLINLLEYALNNDPESGYMTNQVKSVIVNVEGVDYPAIEFPRQYAAEDLTYAVSVSGDTETWFTNGDIGGPFTAEPEVLALGDDGEEYVRVRCLTPLNAPSPFPFMQLNVSYED